MRSHYPVSSKEQQVEFREMQEHIIYLIGSDIQAYDSNIDVSGIYDIDDVLIASGVQNYMYNAYYIKGVENDIQG